MKKRIAILAMGLVMVVANVIAVSPITQTAQAITQEAIYKNTEQFSYYAAVKNCIGHGKMPLTIDSSTPTNEWMGSGDVVVGFSVDNDEGETPCKDALASAINSFGYGSNTTGFLSELLGYKNTSGTTWKADNSDGLNVSDRFTKQAKAKGIPTGETNAITYQLAYDALISGKGCAATETADGTEVTIIVSEVGITKQAKYTFDGGDNVKAFPRASVSADSSVTCSGLAKTVDEKAKGLAIDMVNDANNNARDVFIKALQDNLCPNTTPQERANHADCVSFYKTTTTTCFNAIVNDNDFTFPNYNIATLATCISNKGGDKTKITAVLQAALASAAPSNAVFTPRTPPGGTTNNNPVCSAGALGWIICPLIAVMQSAIQSVADLMDGMLRLDPLDRNTGSGSIYSLWQKVLNVSNIILIVAFLIVIFSQATSMGLSSYGIKKILPRIIAAAILMNISFFLCQVLVDLSNIIGASAGELVRSVTQNATFSSAVTERVSGIEKVAAGGIAIAIIIFFFLVPVLLSFLAVFFTIAARFALIILLVLVAPLAFAAWVLPNTEKYFQKWWSLFFNLLMLYPIIMFVFAAALIASKAVGAASQ